MLTTNKKQEKNPYKNQGAANKLIFLVLSVLLVSES